MREADLGKSVHAHVGINILQHSLGEEDQPHRYTYQSDGPAANWDKLAFHLGFLPHIAK
jgi:hypothetical protein